MAIWAIEAVETMQVAGILQGKDGNQINPMGVTSPAEVSTVLHRYITLVIV